MAARDLIPVPEPLTVVLTEATGVRFSPNELRALKAETGRSMTDLLGPEADDADRMQTIAWLRLRRDGNPVRVGRLRRRRDRDQRARAARPYERRALDELAAFCRFWRMTPRDVDQLTDQEYEAMVRYANRELKAQQRAARKRH